MKDLFDKCYSDGGYFGELRQQKDRYFSQPVLDGSPGARMIFRGREVIMWTVNNYLGLAGHARIQAAAESALRAHGVHAPMGSRMLTGNTDAHIALEGQLADFACKPAAMLLNYGYLGILGIVSALTSKEDTVIIDKLSHACIVDAALLSCSGRRFRVFRHNDPESLEEQLRTANKERRGGILVITEGVFGMSGDVAPIADICELKDRYGARLLVDDAHGCGIMGPNGRGVGEMRAVQDRIDLYFGTFTKAFAAIGGFVAGDENVLDYIRYNARTQIFAKSLPLVYVAAVGAALDVIRWEPQHRERMWEVARQLQQGLREGGFDLGETASPITPVYIPNGDIAMAMSLVQDLRENSGIFVSAVAYPVIPRRLVLLRMIPTAAHSDSDVSITLDAFRQLRCTCAWRNRDLYE